MLPHQVWQFISSNLTQITKKGKVKNRIMVDQTPLVLSPDHSARSDSTRLNWQLSRVESDRQSDHSARRAIITLTTEKN